MSLHDIESGRPRVRFHAERRRAGNRVRLCRGLRRLPRRQPPDDPGGRSCGRFERVYPFGWLGILVDKPPVSDELIYVNHERGFALCSMRSTTRSRYYLQCRLDEQVEDWPDDKFWEELTPQARSRRRRAICRPAPRSRRASRRCAASSPSRCGSAICSWPATPPISCRRPARRASISPRATSPICRRALIERYRDNSDAGLDAYAERALARVWKAERFSWWMTQMLHRFPESSGFDQKIQAAELDYLFALAGPRRRRSPRTTSACPIRA